ncbi:glyoxylate reductase [Grosmannia clavigera kw1407]|uniref:Glyoxylate reductase n=1 Tax=Grosmannia clavigera (strain kw1407 / UAMH 11150) TaxID=655863 RepID=F0X9J0_GROCL|nr:glyoxylate reductase [Grosmannia clavigera kw1407]EFX05291.1 glyoxylate reductase [Grosmannia clavigera kw1407]
MAKPTVLLVESPCREVDPEQWARVQNRFNLLHYDCDTVDEFCRRLAPGGAYAHIDAIVRVGWLKAGPYATHQLFCGRPVGLFPTSLKLICCTGHGFDAADIAGLSARGIVYANAPDTCTEAVANTALFLVLNVFRYFSLAEHAVRADRWFDSRQVGPVAIDPVGQVLGIVGMGDIGLAIARKAALGLGMRIHYHNRKPRPARDLEGLPDGAVYHASLDTLLAVSDCICLACPLTTDTHHMLSTAQFARAKSSGLRLVNIARGGLVDEDALLAAVQAKQVVGVGLDVHANEPDVRPELRANYWTTLLPHIGVCSRTSWLNFDRQVLSNLENYFYGDKKTVTAVNAELLE